AAALVVAVVIGGIAWLGLSSRAPQARDAPSGSAPVSEIAVASLPAEAQETLQTIKRGGPFRYRKDGSVFGNRERRLPRRPHGYYTEYTVRTPAENRGPRRIVAGRGAERDPATSGEYYYTADHYTTFWRIRE
ncbi:MAG: ribonuclease domain-containing protein, partial [Burkholderiaceae bacterium]